MWDPYEKKRDLTSTMRWILAAFGLVFLAITIFLLYKLIKTKKKSN